MEQIIKINNVSWLRQGKVILKNINWEVKKGEHWTVLGLNGSGKTTLLNMINGYIWPSKGTVEVLGHRFGKADLRELRKLIGWVSSAIQERINGNFLTEDIVVSGKFASIGLYEEPSEEDRNRAKQLLKNLGCEHIIHKRYALCSNGEKQKVLIARGLMAQPQLLILDEPTNGLDFIAREALMESIDRLAQQDDAPTMILVTHHIEEVTPSFTHALLLKHGEVFDAGEKENMLTSAQLSSFFDERVHVTWQSHRAWLSLHTTNAIKK